MEIKNGLKPLPKDKRDFRLGAFFGPAKLDIPLKDFLVANPTVKNQGPTFRCTGYAAASVIEPSEKVELSGDYLYAKAKQIEGDVLNGANLRSVCKAAVKYGAVEEAQFLEKDIDDNQIKRWWDLQGYDVLALDHKQKSYFLIDGPYDFFDNIISAIHTHKKPALLGTTWFSDWNTQTEIKKEGKDEVGGHAITGLGGKVNNMGVAAIGTKIINGEMYLVIQNSYGKSVGDGGRQYFSRAVVNEFFKPYGAFMFIDLTDEEILELKRQSAKTLITKLIEIVQGLLGLKKNPMRTLAEITLSKVGTDASPKDIAPDQLSCAETVTEILREYFKQKGIDFPVMVATKDLWRYMQTRADLFQRVYEPQAGDVIISPTGTNTRPDRSKNGHTGIYVSNTDIASSTSTEPNKGDLIVNYTRTTWRNYYHYYAGYPVYLYRLLV